jgi:hypothetical protein
MEHHGLGWSHFSQQPMSIHLYKPILCQLNSSTPPYLRPISVSMELLRIKKPPPDRSQLQSPTSLTGSYRTSGPAESHTWRLVTCSSHSWRHSCKARSWSRAHSHNYSGRSINLDATSTSGGEHSPVAPLTVDSSKDSGHRQRIFSHLPTRSTQGSLESTLTISKFSTHLNQQHMNMTVTRGGRGADPAALAAIAEIQQMNKKRFHKEKKAQEKGERVEKAASQTGADVGTEDGDAQGTVATSSGEIHKIMGGTKAIRASPPPAVTPIRYPPQRLQEQLRLPSQPSFLTPMCTPIQELFWTLLLPSRRRRPSRSSQPP